MRTASIPSSSVPSSASESVASVASIGNASSSLDSQKKEKEEQKILLKTYSASHNARKLKVSKNLHIVKSHKQLSVACAQTGIISLLDIPAIPGFSLVYDSPFADVSNCRGIVQRGKDYLFCLEPQILAGIFITLASEYELFRAQEQNNGAANNAILRAAGKEVLIEALLLIENWIHSRNSVYIPKLSLILTKEESQHSIQNRMANWLKLAAEATVKPDLIVYDEKAKPEKIVFSSVQKVSVKKKQELSAKVFAKRILAQDKKIAKALIPTMKAASKKMKAFLEEIFRNENLVTADSMMVKMLAEKLMSYGEESADRIAEILLKDRKVLKDTSDPFQIEDFEPLNSSAPASISSEEEANAVSIGNATSVPVETNSFAEIVENQQKEEEEMPSFSDLPPFQRILAKKKWLAAQPASVQAKYNGKMEKKEEPKFSSPALSIPAPAYVPSPEKQKLIALADKADELEQVSLLNKIQKSLPSRAESENEIDLDKMDDAPF